MLTDTTAHIKGAWAAEVFRWYAREHPTRIAAMFEALPPAIRAKLEPGKDAFGLLPATWYPAEFIHAMLDAMLRDVPRPLHARLARAAAKATIDGTLKGIYRPLFSAIATPDRYRRYVQRFWQASHDTGQADIVALSDHEHEGHIRGWYAHHPFICDIIVAGNPILYEMMGCTAARTERIRCRGEGDVECAYVTRWRPGV